MFDLEKKEDGGAIELAATAAAEQARAAIQSRYQVAFVNKRSFAVASVDIIDACKRKGFALKARYKKPQRGAKSCGLPDCPHGKGGTCGFICGLSVKAADEIAKHWGNIYAEQAALFEDNDRKIVRVSVTDLQSNFSTSTDITVKKVVQRYDTAGRFVVGERINSKGDKVFLVAATDDEIIQKEAALCAKARRNLLLRLIPADLLEEAEQTIFKTVMSDAQEDPKKATRNIIEAFKAQGIKPDDLEKYLGHSVDGVSPAEIADLRGILGAILDGEIKWKDVIDPEIKDDDEKSSRLKEAIAKATKKREELRNQGKGKKAEKSGEPGQGEKEVEAKVVDEEFKDSLDFLKIIYSEKEKVIDDLLFEKAGVMALPDVEADGNNDKVRKAIIEIAKEMK